jgi:RND superfamily putative drug exporter
VDQDIATAVQPYLTSRAAVIELNIADGPGSDAAHAVLETVRNGGTQLSGNRFLVMAGGETATSVDLTAHMTERAPWAFGLVVAAMALVLLLQFRSFVLPFKAIALNLLSLTASFGALVWVFQDGNLSGVLGFEPLGHTIVVVPLVMFCFIFGLSMDYEVIMLSRIREAWLDSGDNRQAIATGLNRSAGIVTSAATVMFVVFVAFGASDLQVIQQIGLGLALAVLVEATLIRLVALPAAMQLMGRWNWWAPSFVRRDPILVTPAINPAPRSR